MLVLGAEQLSEKKKIITASLWVVGVYGLSQLLRLSSNLIVTRLLEPEMFGIMAIVYVLMQGLAMFSDLGLWAFIVRHKTGTEAHVLNTIWTMQVIRSWIMYIFLVVAALSIMGIKHVLHLKINGIYGKEIFPLILIIVGFAAVINGYQSMAPAILSRDLKQGRLETIGLVSQLIGAIVMIYWAWIKPTIWALVSAGVIPSIISLILTYLIFPIRHQFEWDKQIVREVFHFSKWIVLASILTYLAMQGDKLFFGAYITPAQLGVYSVAFMLANSISSIIQSLSSKIFFPFFCRVVNNERHLLKSIYYRLRSKLDFIVYLFGGLIIAFSQSIIDFLYDKRYTEAGWMLQILSVSVMGTTISSLSHQCLLALGVSKVRMQEMLVRSIGLIICLPLLYSLFGLEGALWAVTINVWLGLPVLYRAMHKNEIFSWLSEIKMVPLSVLGYVFGIAFIKF